MPVPSRGFELDLTDLEPVAHSVLPDLATGLRKSIATILTYDSVAGPGRFDPVYRVEGAYQAFADLIGDRLAVGCDRIDATARALREVIALYRRADGQG
ncbi:MAG TPA: hypothetical protein VGX25_15725 [Actinophytocola sp.]|uniref:hypothetical protein n=1 Tax=Actinophytocola sp. TaxID=1872138 RepID=UPI002DDD5571|nr:hypothetical protein [Actinophytocola sp.]HEV2780834.1 hypothetical protein [Actinophytocola sp.]